MRGKPRRDVCSLVGQTLVLFFALCAPNQSAPGKAIGDIAVYKAVIRLKTLDILSHCEEDIFDKVAKWLD